MGAVHAGWSDTDFASLARHYAYPGSVQTPLESGSPQADPARTSKETFRADKISDEQGSGKKSLFGFFVRPKA